MTPRLRLQKIVVRGDDAADITLGEGLTVVSGPSDTGKSFIVDIIDFMLGARSLRRIPESASYDRAAMQIEISDDQLNERQVVTLTRPLNGGKFRVIEGDIASISDFAIGETLAAEHSARNNASLSGYLLSKLDMSGMEIRKNARNATRSLSFRDLAHFTIIDEGRMQSTATPVWPSGAYVSRTSDESVFKLLLVGDDDSGLIESGPSAAEKRISEERNSVLDRVLWTLEKSLQELSATTRSETRDQLERISRSISAGYESVAAISSERSRLIDQRRLLDQSVNDRRSNVSDLQELYTRFTLLQSQYQSDIERLEMIGESGQLMSMSANGDCILCGAQSIDQHWDTQHDVPSFVESVGFEITKTKALASELADTMSDLRRQARQLARDIDSDSAERSQLTKIIRQFDNSTRPEREELGELLEAKVRLERVLNIHDQILNIENIRKENGRPTEGPAEAFRGLSVEATDEFCKVMEDTLHEWGVSGGTSVRYDLSSRDLVVGGKSRETSGKGMRALIHAAFTVSLARYCVDRDLAHPGFVVVDSPLVTYREPDGDSSFIDEHEREFISERFYSSLSRWDTVQFIVMENVDPIDDSKLEWIRMTKNEKTGRYGFFPR